jgi:CheY-like chemotaxis protein
MRILIAEDEPDICDLYRIALEDRNHQVMAARDGEECLRLYGEEFRNQNSGLPLRETEVSAESDTFGAAVKDKSSQTISSPTSSSVSPSPYSVPYAPFDAVVLDYRMPKRDGIEVAKEILKLNPMQRIIFASAYVKESLEECVKELNQVVELMQKPFDPEMLADTIEDKEISLGLEKLMMNLRDIKHQYSEPTLDQITGLFEGLRKIQKRRTF